MKRARAIALIELIFALAVFSIIGLVVLNLFPTSLMAVSRTEDRLAAQTLAQNEISRVQVTEFENVEFATVNTTQTLDGQVFGVDTTVYAVDGADPALLKGVRVEVSWQRQGQNNKLTAGTYLSAVKR